MSKKFLFQICIEKIILNDIQINLITLKITENQSEMIQKGPKNQKMNSLEIYILVSIFIKIMLNYNLTEKRRVIVHTQLNVSGSN